MDDVEEIKKLKARYFRSLDSQDWETYAGVFAEDCVVDLRRAHGELYNGREEFAAYARSLTFVQSVHHGHMPEIEITSPTTARGIWAMQDFLKMPEGSPLGFKSLVGWGHYTETYELVDGEWKIKTLVLTRLRRDVEV